MCDLTCTYMQVTFDWDHALSVCIEFASVACSMEVANPIHNDNWLEAICTQEGRRWHSRGYSGTKLWVARRRHLVACDGTSADPSNFRVSLLLIIAAPCQSFSFLCRSNSFWNCAAVPTFVFRLCTMEIGGLFRCSTLILALLCLQSVWMAHGQSKCTWTVSN